MKNSNKKSDKIIKFLNGKMFYAIMCVCFIAVGAVAWNGVKSLGSNSKNTVSSQPSVTAKLPDTGRLFGKIDTSSESRISESADTPSATKRDNTPSPKTETAEAVSPAAKFFIQPVLGDVIKGFSDTELQYSLTFRDMRLHKGIDISADFGTPVTAAGDGTVTAVYSDPYLGTVVEIDHGNGITAKYCGLNSAPSVSEGDTVDSSVRLGTVDTVPSESVEQSHIHIEFTLNGKAVSPTKYIK